MPAPVNENLDEQQTKQHRIPLQNWDPSVGHEKTMSGVGTGSAPALLLFTRGGGGRQMRSDFVCAPLVVVTDSAAESSAKHRAQAPRRNAIQVCASSPRAAGGGAARRAPAPPPSTVRPAPSARILYYRVHVCTPTFCTSTVRVCAESNSHCFRDIICIYAHRYTSSHRPWIGGRSTDKRPPKKLREVTF